MIDFKQIRYCKGLEYLCIGVIFSYPCIDIAKYSQLFYHFLRENQFWELYLEGSPRYYSELSKITNSLKEENLELYEEIQRCEGNLKNIFITYFRSNLIYRLDSPEVIRKIFELLFVGMPCEYIEGLGLIRTVVLRALSFGGKRILDSDHFLERMASFLVSDYFGSCECDEKVIVKCFIRLFEV